MLKSQQRFRSKKHNLFAKEVNKITLNASDDKILQSMDSIETYAHGTNRNNTQKRRIEMQQYNKAIHKMIKCDDGTKENINKRNLNWPRIPNHSIQNINNWRLWIQKKQIHY